jgi:hypothetical protein
MSQIGGGETGVFSNIDRRDFSSFKTRILKFKFDEVDVRAVICGWLWAWRML